MARNYDKLVKVPLEKVLPVIGGGEQLQVTAEEYVKVMSLRLRTFKNSLVCVRCGLVGSHFWAERNGSEKYHINLYSINKDGEDVLMTKDHILPRSRGGADIIENMQTMCENCNRKKGSDLEEGLSEKDFPLLPRVQANVQVEDGLPSKSALKRKVHTFTIGDTVCKKSKKAFQNKKRVAVITGFVEMVIDSGLKFRGVTLEGCNGPVRTRMLSKDERTITHLNGMDKTHPLPYGTRKEELIASGVSPKIADIMIKLEDKKDELWLL